MTELKFDPWIAHSMESIQRSGFPGMLSIASNYTLSGPASRRARFGRSRN